jgi:integrase/recombinase XerD
MTQKLNILFYLRGNSIRCRCTINGKRTEFATGQTWVNPKEWNHDLQRIESKNPLEQEVNQQIELIHFEITKLFNEFRYRNIPFSSKTLIEKWKNGGKSITFKDLAQKFIDFKTVQVGTKICKRSIQSYRKYLGNVLEWLTTEKHSELLADDFDYTFADKLVAYLKNTKNHNNAYINKHLDLLRAAMKYGHNLDLLTKNKLKDYNDLKESEPKIVCLTEAEIKRLDELVLAEKYDKVRDILFFTIETGLHIQEYFNLAELAEIQIDIDGSKWLVSTRQKTAIGFDVPISERAMFIIDKYGTLKDLPKYCPKTYNQALKIIGAYAQIDKNLSSKIGRKTFTDIKLNHENFSTDATAQMLGHTTTKHLKHYGKIKRLRIKNELQNIRRTQSLPLFPTN